MALLLPLLALALALSADAFAVALAEGASVREHPWRRALEVGAAFGAAQAIAPLLGWMLGEAFAGLIEHFDYWIAFALLSLIGAKMIYEGASRSDGGSIKPASPLALLGLAIATSIDAAAAGFTLPTLGLNIVLSVTVIGLITFALSTLGVWIGRFGAKTLGRGADIVGGVVLVGLAFKVLLDHGVFG